MSLLKLVQSNTLLNRQLSAICQLNGLTSSGVKANLQSRIANCEYCLSRPSHTKKAEPLRCLIYRRRVLASWSQALCSGLS